MVAVIIATRNRKTYGWCIAVTFGLFVLFDIGRIFALPVPDAVHALIFLVACGSMLYGVWLMYRETGPDRLTRHGRPEDRVTVKTDLS